MLSKISAPNTDNSAPNIPIPAPNKEQSEPIIADPVAPNKDDDSFKHRSAKWKKEHQAEYRVYQRDLMRKRRADKKLLNPMKRPRKTVQMEG
jgi:hypothetical protein